MSGIGLVCVVPDFFDVDDTGRLTLKIVGDRPSEDWPYPCDVGTHNPIRYSDGLGLWTYPRADAMADGSGNQNNGDSTSFASDGDTHNIQSISFDYDNPSNCLDATAFAVVRFDISLTLPGAGGKYLEAFAEFDNGDGSGYDGADRWLRMENTDAANDGHYDFQYETTRIVGSIDPGETRTLRARLSAQASAGAEVTSSRMRMNVLGVTKAS